MWYGKMTQELEKLYDDYYKMFGRTPDGYMELEYGEGSYKAYVRDIKKSLKLKKRIARVCRISVNYFKSKEVG